MQSAVIKSNVVTVTLNIYGKKKKNQDAFLSQSCPLRPEDFILFYFFVLGAAAIWCCH